MKFTIGYYYYDEKDRPFSYILDTYKYHIDEVYFPWINMETCRTNINDVEGYINWDGQRHLENDLVDIKKRGVRLNLLMNANCYGEKSISEYLRNNIYSIIDYIESLTGLDAVTTTSPAIAHIVKCRYKGVEVRASINMMIDTIHGMKYLAELFDGYYIKRENNRNIEVLKSIKKWADNNGKKLYILANSGCMYDCSGQIFHDNLVAHEGQISRINNMNDFNPYTCWNYYSNPKHWPNILKNTWIRPEDMKYYDDIFSVAKIATRMSSNPAQTIQAYIEGAYKGNLLDIMEPAHASILYPNFIDNSKFPEDWFYKTSTCNRQCDKCKYCEAVFKRVLTSIDRYF